MAEPRRPDEHGLPALDELGDALHAAFLREERAATAGRARRPFRSVALATVLSLFVAASATAATVYVGRGGTIVPPDPQAAPPSQSPLAGTAQVTDARASDPDGGPDWALRVSRSETGQVCSTVGQVSQGAFGLIGLDGVFRRLPAEIVDACGMPRSDAASLTGARVFAARDREDVRTVVYGVTAGKLDEVRLTTADGNRRLEVDDRGAFLAILRGYPEESAVRLELRFVGGGVERHAFGVASDVARGPEGGAAFSVERIGFGNRAVCARPYAARYGPRAPDGPTVCGRTDGDAAFTAARTLVPGDAAPPDPDGPPGWDWHDHPPRTLVWGAAVADGDVEAVTLTGAGDPRALKVTEEGAWIAVLPAGVRPADLTVEVRFAGGRVEREPVNEGVVAIDELREEDG